MCAMLVEPLSPLTRQSFKTVHLMGLVCVEAAKGRVVNAESLPRVGVEPSAHHYQGHPTGLHSEPAQQTCTSYTKQTTCAVTGRKAPSVLGGRGPPGTIAAALRGRLVAHRRAPVDITERKTMLHTPCMRVSPENAPGVHLGSRGEGGGAGVPPGLVGTRQGQHNLLTTHRC